MPKGKTVFDHEYFTVYQDKNDKFWIWDKVGESNVAIRKDTEIEAYRAGLAMALFAYNLQRTRRHELENDMEKLYDVFEEVFPREEDY